MNTQQHTLVYLRLPSGIIRVQKKPGSGNPDYSYNAPTSNSVSILAVTCSYSFHVWAGDCKLISNILNLQPFSKFVMANNPSCHTLYGRLTLASLPSRERSLFPTELSHSTPRENPYITSKQKRDTQQHAHTAAAKSVQHDAGRWKILTPYGREASFGSGGFKPEHLTAL
jgi:hypothetical protein